MKAYLLWALFWQPALGPQGHPAQPTILAYVATVQECEAMSKALSSRPEERPSDVAYKLGSYRCIQSTYFLPSNLVAVPAK